MKILLLVQKEQRVILDRFYESIENNSDCDTRWLTSVEQANLKKYFHRNVDLRKYDRVVMFLRFKKELKQIGFIKTVPNLVILEHDAYQNFIECKYTGKFLYYYNKMPWVRVLSSGATVTRRLQEKGVDAIFVPKGYDQYLLRNLSLVRDIELGFIGSTKSVTYSQRKDFLEQLSIDEKLLVTRTKSGDEYLKTLNRIRFFVSADIGMGEYMIKNFEAMACGCVLFAYDQGEEENIALGFKDMENIVLYRSLVDFKEKLEKLRCDVTLAEQIANRGQKLAEQNLTFDHLGKKVVEALIPPLRVQTKQTFFSKLKDLLGI